MVLFYSHYLTKLLLCRPEGVIKISKSPPPTFTLPSRERKRNLDRVYCTALLLEKSFVGGKKIVLWPSVGLFCNYYPLTYSGDHAPLEYIALHSIVLQCTVYTQVSNGTIDDSRIFFEGLFLRIFLDKIF